MKNIKKIFLCSFASLLLLISTLPPLNFSLSSWVLLVPLLYLILKNKTMGLGKVIVAFLFVGLIANFFEFSWILSYRKISFLTVWIICTSIFPVYGFLLYIFIKKIKNIFLRSLIIPSLWIILLKLYSFTYVGYHWGEQFFAYSQKNLFLIQIISILGTTGLSFLILFCNASISLYFVYRNKKAYILLGISVMCIIILFICGYVDIKINSNEKSQTGKIKIALVQPGFSGEPGFEHVTPKSEDSYILICVQKMIKFPQFVSLNKQAEKNKPDIIIWPQYNLPIDLVKPSKISSSMKRRFYTDFSTPILVGTFIYQGQKIANISLLLGEKGEVVDMRTSVVPPPFRQMNQTFAKEFKILRFDSSVSMEPGFNVGSLLCYEDVSAEYAVDLVRKGSDILVTHVNSEVFQKTILPKIHLRRAVFRAIENRRWVIRAATTGISAIIDPYGRVMGNIDLGKMDIMYAEVFRNTEITIFNKYGNVMWIISIIILLTAVFLRNI